MVDPLLTSISDAAKGIGIGRSKFYQLLNSGEIVTVRIGSRNLVVIESLKKFVANSSTREA